MERSENLRRAFILAYDGEIAEMEAQMMQEGEHHFSPDFVRRMQKVIQSAGRRYVRVGKRQVRRAAMVAVIAAALIASSVAALAIIRPQIFYDIKEKATHWDISFEQEDEAEEMEAIQEYILPNVPEGYEVVQEEKDTLGQTIVYETSEGNRIVYSQSVPANGTLGLDSERHDNSEEIINGRNAIVAHNEEEGTHEIIIESDGYIFTIGGSCDYSILHDIAIQVTETR